MSVHPPLQPTAALAGSAVAGAAIANPLSAEGACMAASYSLVQSLASPAMLGLLNLTSGEPSVYNATLVGLRTVCAGAPCCSAPAVLACATLCGHHPSNSPSTVQILAIPQVYSIAIQLCISCNSILLQVYDGSLHGYASFGAFSRAGSLTAVPDVTAPPELIGLPYLATLAAGSRLALYAGTALRNATDWSQLQLLCYGNCSRLMRGSGLPATDAGYAAAGLALDSPEQAVLSLAAGSAVAVLRRGMAALEGGATLRLAGPAGWTLSGLSGFTVLSIQTPQAASAAALFLAPRSTVQLSGPSAAPLHVTQWNHIVLWTSAVGSFLLDSASGAVTAVSPGTSARLASGSVLANSSSPLSSPSLIEVTATGWQLGNGSAVRLQGDRVVAAALLAANSSAQLAAGSVLTVADWSGYVLRLSLSLAAGDAAAASSATRLQPAASPASGVDLPSGTVVQLAPDSVITSITASRRPIPAASRVVINNIQWQLGDASVQLNSTTAAAALFLPPGAQLVSASGAPLGAPVAMWNSALLVMGPQRTLLLDGARGTVATVSAGDSVTLPRSTTYETYGQDVTLAESTTLTVSARQGANGAQPVWALAVGPALACSGSVVAMTAVLADGSELTDAGGRTPVVLSGWYRYLLWAGAGGPSTLLYDTLARTSTELESGTGVRLAAASLLVTHNSGALRVGGGAGQPTELRVGMGGASWALMANDGGSAVASWVGPPAENSDAVLSVAEAGSRIVLPAGPLALQPSSTAVFLSGKATTLYDAALGGSFSLAPGSALHLATGSALLVHDSGTVPLPAAGNLTTTSAAAWQFRPLTAGAPAQSWAVGGDVTGLVAAPAAGSALVLTSPTALTVAPEEAARYAMGQGSDGPILVDGSLLVG
jgi:hypothetical protein